MQNEVRECQECNNDYTQQSLELFCCDDCRIRFWSKRRKDKKKPITGNGHLEDLKFQMDKTFAQGRNIIRSIQRIELEYSDWEDRVVAIEAQLHDIEVEIGIEQEETDNTKVSLDIDFDALAFIEAN